MSKLNVLLVTYAFPPAGGVGILRAASLARYFPEFDIRFDVLTTRNPSSVGADDSHLRDIPAEVTIHRTMTLDLPFGIKKWLKRMLSGKGNPATPSPAAVKAPAGKPNFLKRTLQEFLLPDPQVTWLPILTRAARRIVRERQIDLVLITAAPYSNVLVAERLRKEFPKLSIVLDFRDEWIATAFDVAAFQFSSSSDKAQAFARNAEANAVKAATAVVSVTEAANREIRARYPQQPDSKFFYIPNGFDATRLHRSVPSALRPDGKILVTYVGSIYASTEPTRMVEALHSLPPEIKARFLFRFIGQIEDNYRETLLGLGDLVELKGYLPQHEALAAMNETDYVLLISHDRLNISAKFYDYIGAGKPILACVHPNGDIRLRLEELRAGWWADSTDATSMRQLFLDAAARGASSSFNPDQEKIATYERKPIAKNYAALLHSIAGK